MELPLCFSNMICSKLLSRKEKKIASELKSKCSLFRVLVKAVHDDCAVL